MTRAAKGRRFTVQEYREASAFLERLSGIDAGSVDGNVGPLPPPDLKRRLPEWDAWFAVNRDRLRWDESGERVVVSGDATE